VVQIVTHFKNRIIKKRISTQKLVGLKRQRTIGILIISIGIGIFITPFILVPLINSERVWNSNICLIPEGCPDTCILPENPLIQNKYDIIVFNYQYNYIVGPITFTHLGTNKKYIFNYSLSAEKYMASTTFAMIPGRYDIQGDFSRKIYELWEHGILPQNFEWWAYMGFILISMVIIFVGAKEYQGFERYIESDYN